VKLTEVWTLAAPLVPELTSLACPKRYCGDGRFHSQIGASAAVLGCLLDAHRAVRDGAPLSNPHEYDVMHQLACMQVPTYFVAPALLKAALATTIPANFRWSALRWPLESMLFILPRGSVKLSDGQEFSYVAYAHHTPGVVQPASPLLPGVRYEEEVLSLTAGTEDGLSTANAITITDTQPVLEATTDAVIDKTDALNLPGVPTDVCGLTREVALKLILALNARPELVVMGSQLRSAKCKHGRVRSELWSPNVIGGNYATRVDGSDAGDGEHGTAKRLHWVRGHYRQQPYGPRDTPRYETIWIEPFMAGSVLPA
jgi:hypothetical protein